MSHPIAYAVKCKERVEAGEVCISFDSVANVCRVFGLCK